MKLLSMKPWFHHLYNNVKAITFLGGLGKTPSV